MTAWSPLARLGTWAREVPSAPPSLRLLDAPAPRVGQLWSTGTPAALAHEADDAWGEIRFRGGGDDGEYRRPLDARNHRALQLSALRWQPLGERSGVAGRVVADETTSDVGSPAIYLVRHSPDPFVFTDTTTPPMRHVQVRLESAYGWRTGPWAIGAGLGLEMSDDRTRKARAARLGRVSAPALSLGLLRVLSDSGLSVSVTGRWAEANENSRIALPGGIVTEVIELDGLGDPEPRRATGPSVVGRNVGRNSYALGGGLAGRLGKWHWLVHGEREHLENVHVGSRLTDEVPNKWEAKAWRVGLDALGRAGPLRAMVSARYAALDGDAFRRDLEGQGAIFRGRQRTFTGFVDLRATDANSVWIAGLRVSVGRRTRLRRDFLVRVTEDIMDVSPGLSVEAARWLSERVALSLGGSFSRYEPSGTILDSGIIGRLQPELVAPELPFHATAARAYAASATVLAHLPQGMMLVARGRFDRSGPVDPVPGVGAERSLWSISAGVVWVAG
ncbi:MAG: hypothetical protein OXH08_06515 [Gammaproteobacteria bacterium]|nr:hypothetical protein [Gammaproteobacteria bacterium]